MPNGRGSSPSTRQAAVLAIGLLAVLGAAAGSREDAIERLRSMPLEHRRHLRENLDAFRKLPSDEQARIRELDRAIAALAPDLQERYHEVMRRYVRWIATLSESDRARLDQAGPSQRMTIVRELLAAGAGDETEPGLDRTLAAYWNVQAESLLDQAHWIRCWYVLSPEQRTEVNQAPPENRAALLERLGRQLQVSDDRPETLRKYQGEIRDRLRSGSRDQTALLEAMTPQAREALARRMIEGRWLTSLQPEPVSRRNFDRFVSTLPGWLLEPIDPLPPEAARIRLTLLYRLAFPAPNEVPEIRAVPTESGGTPPVAPAPPPVPTPPPTPKAAPKGAVPF